MGPAPEIFQESKAVRTSSCSFYYAQMEVAQLQLRPKGKGRPFVTAGGGGGAGGLGGLQQVCRGGQRAHLRGESRQGVRHGN